MDLTKGLLIVLLALAVSGCSAMLKTAGLHGNCPADRTDVFAFQCLCTYDNTGG